MDTIRRTVSSLLVSSLVLVLSIGIASATPIDGLETRFGSGEGSDVASSGAIDGLEARYGSAAPSTAAATSPATHLDGLETRFAGVPAPDARPLADTDGGIGVAAPVTVAVVALAALLGAGFGYLAGKQRARRVAHA